MVLESVIIPSSMEKTPKSMLYVGFTYATIGLLLAYWIFGSYSSLSGVFITSMPLVVIIYNVLKLEERKDEEFCIYERYGRPLKRTFLIKQHGYALSMFMFLFIGMVMAYSLWSTILPENMIDRLFGSQIETIRIINPSIPTADFVDPNNPLLNILYNNFKVLMFCILFSFLYGSGAIFILTWNASVLGVAVGSIIRNSLVNYTHLSRSSFLYNYLGSFSISFSFAIHGIPEIAAYFLGSLGGGIISVAVVNHKLGSQEFRSIVIDSIDLILLSAAILLLAGIIEIYITPALI
ncbi:MAG: stage II sporulation protein M [Candidatus Altiarchaeota archaeon]|nr:stage II sporulation protein M [Candidatus Altiarchaeota archaeon]